MEEEKNLDEINPDEKTLEESLDTFVLDDTEYKTINTRKFQSRKPYSPVDYRIIKAFIPGTIIVIKVKAGQKVKAGETLVVFEAMKMDNNIICPFDTVVKKINVKAGDLVTKETVIMELK